MIFFYSGHGRRTDNGDGALALLDGELTREVLYDEVLAALPARLVHLLVDACHAEAVVRPRDLQARSVDLGEGTVADYLQKQTLARFPHVGAVVATTSSAEAHEWDRYRAGVFTHELLSALRGAADVDGNRRIEYSELAAFLAAANREVADRRALLQTVVTPPAWTRARRSSTWPTCWPLVVHRGAARVPGLRSSSRTPAVTASSTCAPRRDFKVRLAVPVGATSFTCAIIAGEAGRRPGPGERVRCREGSGPRRRLRSGCAARSRRGISARPVRDALRARLLPGLRQSQRGSRRRPGSRGGGALSRARPPTARGRPPAAGAPPGSGSASPPRWAWAPESWAQ